MDRFAIVRALSGLILAGLAIYSLTGAHGPAGSTDIVLLVLGGIVMLDGMLSMSLHKINARLESLEEKMSTGRRQLGTPPGTSIES